MKIVNSTENNQKVILCIRHRKAGDLIGACCRYQKFTGLKSCLDRVIGGEEEEKKKKDKGSF